MPRLVLLLLAALVAVPAWAGSTTTADEEATLRTPHGVVVRELRAREEGAVRIEALVDIQASQAAVWAAVIDFPARVAINKSLKSVAPYRSAQGSELWYRFTGSSFGIEFVYHNHYRLSPDRMSLSYELDRTQPNDLDSNQGSFELLPSPAGASWCRLLYEAESNFGHSIPTAMQRWLSTSGAKDFMADIARRAEAAK